MKKFYTGTGDDGTTGLLGKARVPKYHPQPEAFGAVDEASATLGLVRATIQDREVAEVMVQAQRDLYHLMAELAATPETAAQFRTIDAARVDWLEAQIDAYGKRIEPLNEFAVPGDSLSGALLDLARTIVRRAERRVVKLRDDGLIENDYLIGYLNRLSTLCYVLARYEDTRGRPDQSTSVKAQDRP